MANSDSKTALDAALEHVPANRRDFLKRLLGGTAAVAALPLIATDATAQPLLPFGIGKGVFGAGAAKGVVRPAPVGPVGKGGGAAPRASGGGKGGGGGRSSGGKGGGGGRSSSGKGGGGSRSGGGKGGR